MYLINCQLCLYPKNIYLPNILMLLNIIILKIIRSVQRRTAEFLLGHVSEWELVFFMLSCSQWERRCHARTPPVAAKQPIRAAVGFLNPPRSHRASPRWLCGASRCRDGGFKTEAALNQLLVLLAFILLTDMAKGELWQCSVVSVSACGKHTAGVDVKLTANAS